ncbi:hypothetical protein DPEC_G00320970 [Dallia pectoralis]|uniref:Uncharacterized protein n=1 Tax=Dallia pectoralis TaxID=75939 RepID=A0ACC2FA01_DALPE|nr:hypothetical protein DPEC_G00320970 [Dallia pectoralis]
MSELNGKEGKRGENTKGTGNKRNKKKNPTGDSPQAEPKLKEMKSVEVFEGRKTLLKCELGAGNPLPKFKWYKDGVVIASGKNKLKDTKFKKKKEGKVSELHFTKATDVHAGSYTCEAINNLGKTNTIGNLTLLHGKTHDVTRQLNRKTVSSNSL